MALTTYHHGITATETSRVTPIMKSISMSTIALVTTSTDADVTAYPLDTPVILPGITTEAIAKAGSNESLLRHCLRTIKSIGNTQVVVLRLSDASNVDTLDSLLSCQSRLGVTPKILIAPEIDAPAMTRKLVEIAKKRRGFVYASPRSDDGSLLTDITEIAAYRDTFAARELMLIENGWGEPAPGKPEAPDGGGNTDIESWSTKPSLSLFYAPSTQFNDREPEIDTVKAILTELAPRFAPYFTSVSETTAMVSGSFSINSNAEFSSSCVISGVSLDNALATSLQFCFVADYPDDLQQMSYPHAAAKITNLGSIFRVNDNVLGVIGYNSSNLRQRVAENVPPPPEYPDFESWRDYINKATDDELLTIWHTDGMSWTNADNKVETIKGASSDGVLDIFDLMLKPSSDGSITIDGNTLMTAEEVVSLYAKYDANPTLFAEDKALFLSKAHEGATLIFK